MQRLVIVLLGMASLVASGVIMDRGRFTFNTMDGLGMQNVQGKLFRIKGPLKGNISKSYMCSFEKV